MSIAQFEREAIGERVRDKIAASKRRGIWVGGLFRSAIGASTRSSWWCLAETVRTIFARCLALGSIGAPPDGGPRPAWHPDLIDVIHSYLK